MTRPIRIEYPGALYHITARGNEKRDIFTSIHERITFLKILDDTCERYNWIVHAYCLMNNHYHLIVETIDPTLSSGMRLLNSKYSQIFNLFHSNSGHLFQGRFHSKIIDQKRYLYEAIRYVELNPVRASICKNPEDWRWNSLYEIINSLERLKHLSKQHILSFDPEDSAMLPNYLKFMHAGIHCETLFNQRKNIIGDENFIKKIMLHSSGKRRCKDISKAERFPDRPSLKKLFFQATTKNERDLVICDAHIKFGYKMIEIAHFLKMTPSSISRIFRQYKGFRR